MPLQKLMDLLVDASASYLYRQLLGSMLFDANSVCVCSKK
jgi:hypothetical protein